MLLTLDLNGTWKVRWNDAERGGRSQLAILETPDARQRAAIFWMYNDCWPTVRSWTIVDNYLRRTPAFHLVRQAMEPVHLILVEEKDQVAVFGVNDTQSIRGQLRYGIFALAGKYGKDDYLDVELPPNASTLLASFPPSNGRIALTSCPLAYCPAMVRCWHVDALLTPVQGNGLASGRSAHFPARRTGCF